MIYNNDRVYYQIYFEFFFIVIVWILAFYFGHYFHTVYITKIALKKLELLNSVSQQLDIIEQHIKEAFERQNYSPLRDNVESWIIYMMDNCNKDSLYSLIDIIKTFDYVGVVWDFLLYSYDYTTNPIHNDDFYPKFAALCAVLIFKRVCRLLKIMGGSY